MTHLAIHHTTRYRYEQAVTFSPHQLFLYPRESQVIRADSFEIETQPEANTRWVRDCFENIVLRVDYGLTKTDLLEFKATIHVRLRDTNPFDFILDTHALGYPMRYLPHETQALSPYLCPTPQPGASKVLDWFYTAVKNPNQSDNIVSFLAEINQAVFEKIAYQRRDEEGIQTPDETLAKGSGSCRDMAVLMIAIARQLGLAARFVSGYLYDPPGGEDGERIFNRAHGSMHAWLEIYLPGAGWKGFDPTNGILANHFFIPTAVAGNPAQANPVQGRYYHDVQVPSHMEIELKMEEIT